MERARALSGSDVSTIAVRDHCGFTFVANEGMRRDGLGASTTAQGGLLHDALTALHAVSARHYRDEPRLPGAERQNAEAEGIASMTVTPISLDGAVVALLYVGSRTVRDYTMADRNLLDRIAGFSGAALRNASLFMKAETANYALEEALGRTGVPVRPPRDHVGAKQDGRGPDATSGQPDPGGA